ncbi:MAG: thymidine phosphorylase [Bowdeniella nasicola]|nr:thymidine phosphorylase [Bowdeniella nasicola]
MTRFTAVDIIHQKRAGQPLSAAQIDWIVHAFTTGEVADEQMAALAMAIYFQGMEIAEIAQWTSAMIASGDTMDFSTLENPTVDKHSTGGVGDNITLMLAPLVAVFDVAVPQLSGRGLGHTGGTLDKLEAIPGWRATLTTAEMLTQLGQIGAVICAAGAGLAPADKKLYALRDITGTVDAVALIASSIMSKKIAEGTGALVLDVKVGAGAFMKTPERARELAETMCELGRQANLPTTALLTDMSQPLGSAAGNALEVATAVEILAGGGPADTRQLTIELAQEMLRLAGKTDVDVAAALDDGRAMDKWRAMIAAQGGDADAPLPKARHRHTITAPTSGYISQLDALAVGEAAWRLGAGRAKPGDAIQAEAGVQIHAKVGDYLRAGSALFTLHTQTPERFESAIARLHEAVNITDTAPPPAVLIHERIRR